MVTRCGRAGIVTPTTGLSQRQHSRWAISVERRVGHQYLLDLRNEASAMSGAQSHPSAPGKESRACVVGMICSDLRAQVCIVTQKKASENLSLSGQTVGSATSGTRL